MVEKSKEKRANEQAKALKTYLHVGEKKRRFIAKMRKRKKKQEKQQKENK